MAPRAFRFLPRSSEPCCASLRPVFGSPLNSGGSWAASRPSPPVLRCPVPCPPRLDRGRGCSTGAHAEGRERCFCGPPQVVPSHVLLAQPGESVVSSTTCKNREMGPLLSRKIVLPALEINKNFALINKTNLTMQSSALLLSWLYRRVQLHFTVLEITGMYTENNTS